MEFAFTATLYNNHNIKEGIYYRLLTIISSKITGIFSLNNFKAINATSLIWGCAASLALNLKKCLHSLKFIVITISVFNEFGNIDSCFLWRCT